MIIERRQEPRTHLITTPITKPVCRIIKMMAPPQKLNGEQQLGIFLAYSPITRKVVIGKDYLDAFMRFNEASA
jgi:hypothetical protein